MIAFWAVLFCSPVSAQENALDVFEQGLNELIYQLSRSVVTVEAYYPQPAGPSAAGPGDPVFNVISSGLIFDSVGHVLTVASSVIGRPTIQIRFDDQIVPAEVKGIDYRSGLALLQASKPVGVPVKLSLQHSCAGQMVIALGNAYGLRAAPSMGFCAGVRPDGVVQFTAPISSGTLGGGLFNLSGRLIGVISGGIQQKNQGEIGLAVPSVEISEAAGHLIANGDRLAGYLGLSTTEIEIYPPIEISQAGSGDYHVRNGVVVTSVVASSPAARAGIRKGDLVFSVNRQAVPSALQLANMIKQSTPGTIVELGFMRQSRSYFVPVKIGQAQIRSFSSSLTVSFEQYESIDVTDSLLREIESLRETIESLEQRLKQLR